MNTKKIRLTAAQLSFSVGAIQENKSKIIDTLEQSEKIQSDIVIFPELSITGYPPEDLLLRESFIGKNFAVLEEIAEYSGSSSAIVGFVDRSLNEDSTDNYDRKISNAAAIVQNGDVKGIYHKCFLPNYSVFDEARYFAKGSSPADLFWYEDVAIGINICEDIWIDNGPAEMQVQAGASIIVNINASPFDINKTNSRRNKVMEKAKKLNVPIIYLNMVGGQDELVFDGGSFVVDSAGEILYQAKQFEEEIFSLDLEVQIKDIISDSKLTLNTKKQDLPILKPQDTFSELESMYEALKLGVSDYVRKNNFQKVLVGLSGGIDSALTATIAVDALSSDNVIGIAMPSKYNPDSSLEDAKNLAQNLGIEFKVIEIEETVEKLRTLLKESLQEPLSGVTDENIQSRIRGNIIMGLSNQLGAMVLSTGNKSEMAVGYSTLYGDLAGGFALLKDVYKTEVYKLSEFRNNKSEVIPLNSITKEPSAELRDDQFDSDSLPDYELLDKILKMYIESDFSSEKIIASGIENNIVYDVLEKVDKNEYKRKQVAPGVKLTERAFGKDRRMPITNTYIRERYL
ncbi:MAG: NAD+ synthase [Candidatus Actinomarina sp.]|nr:NAD+ synthase [Candidatus Actinomarina sp.]MBL6837275.1 NAD+ synthase [Candidatus Actinomarina sp.]MDB4823894.1 NAD+ synthase [Acidimicrobiia bacterium]